MLANNNGSDNWRRYLQIAALMLLTACVLLLTFSTFTDNAAMGAATAQAEPGHEQQSGSSPICNGPCGPKTMLNNSVQKRKAPGPVLTNEATATRTRTPTRTGTPPTPTSTFPGPMPTNRATSTATRLRTATRTGTPPTPTNTPCGGPRPWQFAAPIPTGVADYAFAQDSNSFYVIAGVSNGFQSNSVRRYDLSANTWTTLASIPYGDTSLEAVLYNGKIYVAGNYYYYNSDTFQIYDIASNTWSTGPSLPSPAYGGGIGAYNGNVYVAGGGYEPSSTTTLIYNIASNSWSVGDTMPAPFSYGGYTQVGQYLYLVGGYGYSPSKGHEVQAAADPRSVSNRHKVAPYANSVATQRLDMATGEWSSGPVFTPGRADFALASDGTKLYAIGGDLQGGSNSDPSDQVDELSLLNWPSGRWAPSPANLPSPRLGNKAGFFSSALLGGEIWSTGGSEGSYTALADNLYRIADPCASPTSTPTGTQLTPTITRTRTITPSPTPTVCNSGGSYSYVQTQGGIEPGVTDTGNHCADCATFINLPFAYQFYGFSFNSAYVSSKGVLEFNSSSSEWRNTCSPTSNFYYAIMAHWDDLRTDCGGCGVYTSITGSAPNRVFNIEWRTNYFSFGGVANFEIQLYEGQSGAAGRFDLIYGQVEQEGTGATVAVQRDSGSRYTLYECNIGGLTPGLRLIFTQPPCGTYTPTATGTPPTATITRTRTSTPTVTATPCNFTTNDSITSSDPVQNGILYRYYPSLCGYPQSCPGYSDGDPHHYDAYTFTNANNSIACITVNFTDTCYSYLTSYAYATDFNPDDLCDNYVAQSANYGDTGSYSFYVSAGATFVIVMAETYSNAGCGSYTLNVSGFTCATPTPTATPCNPSCTPTSTRTITPTHTRTDTPTPTATVCGPTGGIWSQQAPYPTAITQGEIVQHGGFIYSFGGFDGFSNVPYAYKYDPVTNFWTSIAPLPSARAGAGLVSDGTFIYIIGGFDAGADNATNTLYRYDPITNSYTTLAPSITANGAHAAAYFNGKIYRIAGFDNNSNRHGTAAYLNGRRTNHGIGAYGDNPSAYTNTVEVYTISSNSWAPAAPYPLAVDWFSAVVYGNYIYTAGGFNTNKTYRYDPATNTWDDNAIADLPGPIRGAASDMYSGLWMIAGGVNSSPTNQVIAWNPSGNNWLTLPNMLQGRGFAGGAATNQGFYAVGGYDSSFDPSTDNQRYTGVPCTSPTPTNTPASGGVINGHLTWQSINQPNAHNTLVTGTLILCTGSTPNTYTFHTDQNGNFSVTSGLPDGAYGWRVQGPRHLSSSGNLTITGGSATVEFGNQRTGDTNANNIVNTTDFNNLKVNFGQNGDRPTDFNFDNITNALDFNSLKITFGQGGPPTTCP